MKLYKKIFFGLFPHRIGSRDFVEKLRDCGVPVGEGTVFFSLLGTR